MKIKFRNYLDYGSVTEAFENDITFTMMKNAVKYDIENNIKTLEEESYCYFTPYNNVVNIRYEVMDISDNEIIIDIYFFKIDKDYKKPVISLELNNFKHTFKEE